MNVSARLGRLDGLSVALAAAYASGVAGVVLAVLRGTRGVTLTLLLLALAFCSLFYASLVVLARHA